MDHPRLTNSPTHVRSGGSAGIDDRFRSPAPDHLAYVAAVRIVVEVPEERFRAGTADLDEVPAGLRSVGPFEGQAQIALDGGPVPESPGTATGLVLRARFIGVGRQGREGGAGERAGQRVIGLLELVGPASAFRPA